MGNEPLEENDPIYRMFAERPVSEARKDPLIGEIVRILLRADTASFARIYAVAKAEEAAMNAETQETLRDLWGRSKRRQRDGDEQAHGPEQTDDASQ
jgi:hypothetical protein